jgi:hypothetical protein
MNLLVPQYGYVASLTCLYCFNIIIIIIIIIDVLRRSARKSRMERIKNEHIKKIMGVKKKPDIIDIIERKRLQWYGHVKGMQEERIPELIMVWIPRERRK